MSPTVRHTLLLAGAALLTSCASLHLHKGDKGFDLMQYRKASEHYDRALRSSPERRAQLRLAEAHYHRNDPHRAREFYALADATQRLSGDTGCCERGRPGVHQPAVGRSHCGLWA